MALPRSSSWVVWLIPLTHRLECCGFHHQRQCSSIRLVQNSSLAPNLSQESRREDLWWNLPLLRIPHLSEQDDRFSFCYQSDRELMDPHCRFESREYCSLTVCTLLSFKECHLVTSWVWWPCLRCFLQLQSRVSLHRLWLTVAWASRSFRSMFATLNRSMRLSRWCLRIGESKPLCSLPHRLVLSWIRDVREPSKPIACWGRGP